MADNTSPGDAFRNTSSDSQTENSSDSSNVDNDLLKSIDKTLNDILVGMGKISQSAAKGSMPGSRGDANKWSTNRRSGKSSPTFSTAGIWDSFTEGIEKALLDSIGASGFKDKLKEGMSGLAEELGVEVDKLPEALGKELGKAAANTSIGKAITGRVKGFFDRMVSDATEGFNRGRSATSVRDAVRRSSNTSPSSSDRTDRGASAAQTQANQRHSDMASEQAADVSDIARRARSTSSNMPTRVQANVGQNVPTPPADVADVARAGVDIAESSASQAGADLINSIVSSITGGLTGNLTDNLSNLSENPATNAARSEEATVLREVTATFDQVASTGQSTSTVLSGLTQAAGNILPRLLAAAAVLIIIDKALEAFGPAIEGAVAHFKAMSKAANRYNESRKKNLELEKKRIADDVESMIKAPFQILEDSVNRVTKVWDDQLRTIAGTQGYNKSDVQDLMSVYAQRLRDEGLTSVVSGTDIMDNLSKVLQSGLSGQVAEEFAYLASKLNAAVPTQDFFSYADTYASVAANAIKAGKSQQEAIAYANAEIEAFASNVLYASRQLSGGFSTGLKDAQKLFDYAVQIANASKQGDAALISGVLTSVSAVTGAIAPDLAGEIVEAVVKAATGGNSSEIVALRSLAGINASNTEFLNALAKNPQKVFSDLFRNLAKMQNMSNDNYMEVAEGLSSVFGISMDAFARVDFNYLANAISQMNVNNASLDENMKLLASGQTTTTAEQLRMAQINQYMLEEGLSYVLDNEVARAIQQHMWDEQIARELQESTYAVELQGSALQFLEGLKQTVDNIKDFLNPLSFLKKLTQLSGTAKEADALKADTLQMLLLGQVGKGNMKSLYNLTTTNKDLKLVDSITQMMGGISLYKSVSDERKAKFEMLTPDLIGGAILDSYKAAEFGNQYMSKSSPASKYGWANISKTAYSIMSSGAVNTQGISTTNASANSTADLAKSKSNAAFEKFLGTMEQAVADSKTYDEWAATAKNYGIKDFADALESFGRTEEELRGAFGAQEANQASKYESERRKKEETFWEQLTLFALNQQSGWIEHEKLVVANQESMIIELEAANKKLADIHTKEKEFLSAWTSYYVDHTAYSRETLSSYKAADIINSEKKENGDAVLALANALTDNTIGIKEGFKDPVVQTNVLLAKILIVAEAIMQQNNTTGGLTLPDTLSALSLGITPKAP